MESPQRARLTPSNDRMVAGVCSGLAEYLDVDPTIVRGAWVVVVILGMLPPAVVAYIALMVIMPKPDAGAASVATVRRIGDSALLLGGALVAFGLLMLMRGFAWLQWFGWGVPHLVVPALLIAGGIFLLTRRRVWQQAL